jgi:hypothetical protein
MSDTDLKMLIVRYVITYHIAIIILLNIDFYNVN